MVQPPIVPRVRHTGDTRNFFDYPEENIKNQQLILPVVIILIITLIVIIMKLIDVINFIMFYYNKNYLIIN